MLSPSGLSLRVPRTESPERRVFKSRSFWRLVLSALVFLILLITTVQNITLRIELQQVLALDYLGFGNGASSEWFYESRRGIEPSQASTASYTVSKKSENKANKPCDLQKLMNRLPEVIRIPFEEAVADVELQGWEDEWFSGAQYNVEAHGLLAEPKIDFVYNWVNGSEEGFNRIRHKYELSSPLNDENSEWVSHHSINRYRDWDELRYSFRSLDKYVKNFTNKVQLLVNSVIDVKNDTERLRPQKPTWLKDDDATRRKIEILSQEDFFEESQKQCLPSFDSLSLETQIYNTPSNVDHMIALSDDMFLGAPHSAADFFSPLFGPMLGFKHNHYNTKNVDKPPTFGEKPHLYYTSWLLNHRFGERDRKVQAHFTHSVSRRVMKEAMQSFPSPALRGACERFRGESQFQIYPWYTAFHYSIERFREALLWSFIMIQSDINDDGYLDWTERKRILHLIRPGRKAAAVEDDSTPVRVAAGRDRIFYHLPEIQERAGLQPPLSNANVLWTSLDGPETVRDIKCNSFHIDKCLAESFDSPISDNRYPNPDFSASNIFSNLSRRDPRCGDCIIKFMLATAPRGLEPLLPPKSKPDARKIAIKALVKYQHTIIEPDGMFIMVKDAEQVQTELFDRAVKRGKRVSQWCLNDDVMTEDEEAVAKVDGVVQRFYRTLFPTKGRWEK